MPDDDVIGLCSMLGMEDVNETPPWQLRAQLRNEVGNNGTLRAKLAN